MLQQMLSWRMESAKKPHSHATYSYKTGFASPNVIINPFVFHTAFTMEQDIPDYDMDSDDEKWINSQAEKLEISPLQVMFIECKIF